MGHGMVFALNACWSTLGSLVRDKNRRLVFEPRAALVYPPKRPLFSSSTCCFYFYPPTYACRLSNPVLLVYVADARRRGGCVLFFSAFWDGLRATGRIIRIAMVARRWDTHACWCSLVVYKWQLHISIYSIIRDSPPSCDYLRNVYLDENSLCLWAHAVQSTSSLVMEPRKIRS
ncbi:hypothetical protein CCHR01_00460 [Colletotrichum chrysophilum]|uniref:Uncharacterized protein n=1 Tax=Colletotrichum chrysophilum TaxID=1836956 RepID=A0AAD9AY93_9PEZI|nr:hypothetical protein CCHR01_00460 [Colletotrichum chrysophilum]